MAKIIKASKKKLALVFMCTAIVSVSSAFLVIRFLPSLAAGSSTFTFNPTSYSKSINSTFTVPVYMSISGDSANAVELDIGYDSNVLSIPSTSGWTNSSPCNMEFASTNTAGHLVLSLGCTSAVTTSNVLVTTINFTAKGAGTSALTFNSGTKAVNGSTGVDVPRTYTNGTVTVVDTVNSLTSSATRTKIMPVTGNKSVITVRALNSTGVAVANKAVTVAGTRTGDTITPASGTLTDNSGYVTYTLTTTSTTTGAFTLTFTADGKSTTVNMNAVKAGDISGESGSGTVSDAVNITDAAMLMASWNQTAAAGLLADLNCDGIVDISDANILMANWSK